MYSVLAGQGTLPFHVESSAQFGHLFRLLLGVVVALRFVGLHPQAFELADGGEGPHAPLVVLLADLPLRLLDVLALGRPADVLARADDGRQHDPRLLGDLGCWRSQGL